MSHKKNWHVLKCWPDSFNAILGGEKTYEVRVNDRDYQLGDVLVLREYMPEWSARYAFKNVASTPSGYTWREMVVDVVHIVYTDDKRFPATAIECPASHKFAVMGIKTWDGDEARKYRNSTHVQFNQLGAGCQ